jgi:hypothetical protein
MRTPRTKIRRKEDKKGILGLTEITQTPPKSSDSCTQEHNKNNNQQNLRILLLHFTNYNSESNPFPQTHRSKRRQNKPHQKSSDSCTQGGNYNYNQKLQILLLHFRNDNSENNPIPQTLKSLHKIKF